MSEDGLTEQTWIKVANVQRVKRDNGRVDLYFRTAGHREGPLLSADGSQALQDEVGAIKARLEAAAKAIANPRAGTIGEVLKIYNNSAEFLANARSTQGNYQDYIDEMIEDCGQVLLSEVTRSWLVEMRDAWALRGHRAANLRLQVLKNAFEPIIADDADDRIAGDPFHKLKKVRRPHDAPAANVAWSESEVTIAIEEAFRRRRAGLARAIALGAYGGFRRGTICAIPLNARTTVLDDNGQLEQRLNWITEKKKVLCDKREDSRLTAVMKRSNSQAITIAYNADGRPWKARQLSQAVDRHMAGLARRGLVRAATDDKGEVFCPLSLHGLRHFRGLELAYNGASDAEIMAQLEHATDRAAKIYRRQAERRTLADAGQTRLDNVVKLKAAKAARNRG